VADIFKANMKRAEESVRVLEEFSKLSSLSLSNRFKAMRFKLYSLEKGALERL
jgi:thiamine-phosphate pyrophosphorylase